MKKDFLLKLDSASPEITRLLLITKNYFFNKLIDGIRNEKNLVYRKLKTDHLSSALSLPKVFTWVYVDSKKIFLRNIEAQQNIYYVHDSENGKQIIAEDGVYIKFDPDKSNKYYETIIKQIRSSFAFMDASEEEKEDFLKNGGHTALNYLQGKVAKKKRHQHGYNKMEDINIYIKCEKEIENVFLSEPPEGLDNYEKKEYEKKLVKDALDTAALDLKREVKTIYYEVCRRYNLPTFRTYPHLGQVIKL